MFSKAFFFQVVKSQDWVVKKEHFTTQTQLLTTLKKKSFENIVGKGENAVSSIFSFFQDIFYQSQKEFLFLIYIYFVICKCFELDQS